MSYIIIIIFIIINTWNVLLFVIIVNTIYM